MTDFLRKLCMYVALLGILLGVFLYARASASVAGPSVDLGKTFTDPSFGTTIRRLSDVFPSTGSSLIYGMNGLWNADATLYAQNSDSRGNVDVIDTHTGGIVIPHAPFSPAGDSAFDPVNPDIFYYFKNDSLLQYSISTKTWKTIKIFPLKLGSLGGSADFIDRTGRYFLLNIGGQLKIWDKQNDVLYAGSIEASVYDASGGWAGISPDGNYVVVDSGWNHMSYKINHRVRTVDTAPVLFWALCGDHADIISTSDGNTYEITSDCYDSPDVYLVNVSAAKFPPSTLFAGVPKFAQNEIDNQKKGNIKLFSVTWNDAMHFSCAETSNWCYVSIEPQNGDWRSGEIVRVLATAPYTVEHLAKSGSLGRGYTASARVDSSPDGSRAMFASDFGYDNSQVSGYSDIYAVETQNTTSPPDLVSLQLQLVGLLQKLIALYLARLMLL